MLCIFCMALLDAALICTGRIEQFARLCLAWLLPRATLQRIFTVLQHRLAASAPLFFCLAAVALALLPLRCSLLVAAASTASSSLTSAFSSDLGFFLLCRAYEVFFVRSAADRLDRAGVRSRWCAQVAQDVRPMRTGDELGPTRCRRRHHE